MNTSRMCIAVLCCAAAALAQSNDLHDAPGTPHGTGTFFRFAPGHFSFTMPYYWTAISDTDLAAYKATLRDTFPNRPIPKYVLAIQRKALFTFALPYALFEIEERAMPSPQDVEHERIAFSDSVRKAYLDLRRQGSFGEVKPMEAQFDPQRNVIIGYWEMMRASDKRRIAALAAMFPCRYGYLRLHIFLPADRQDAFLPVMDELISSLQFDAGYGYDASQARPRRRRLSTPTALAIFAALAIIWLVLRFLAVRASRAAKHL